LPHELVSVAHCNRKTGSVLGTNSSLPETSYLLHTYIQKLLGNILRMTIWLVAAGWFYRCGPPIKSGCPIHAQSHRAWVGCIANEPGAPS
jgi:hypothetical protein